MPTDFLISTNMQPLIDAGDLATGDSTLQHQQLLLTLNKGDLKEFPLVGVGVRRWLKHEDPAALPAEVKRAFEADGMKVKRITLANNQQLTTEAAYND